MIKLKKEDKIKEINFKEDLYSSWNSISWFSDEYEDIISKLFLLDGNKINNYIADDLYIEDLSFREKYFLPPIQTKTITYEDIAETREFKNKSNDEIINELINKPNSHFYTRYYVEYLLKNNLSIEEIIAKINKVDNYENIGDILWSFIELDKKNRDKVYNIVKNSKFKFLSINLILELKNNFKAQDINELVDSFNAQKFNFLEHYTYGSYINTFEGRFFDSMISLFIEDKKYKKEEIISFINNIQVKNKSFQGTIDAYKYMLSDFKIDNYEPSYIFSMIEVIYNNFTLLNKIIQDDYLELFVIYIKYYIKNQNKIQRKMSIENHLIFMIKNLPWEKISSIIKMIEENDKIFQNIGFTIFQKEFNLKECPSFKDFFTTKYYYENIKLFSYWFIRIFDYKTYAKDEEIYEMDFVVDFFKTNKYSINPYDFHKIISFCKINNFNISEIKYVLTRIQSAKPEEMMKSINSMDENNMFPYLIEKLTTNEIIIFSRELEEKGIPIPPELSKYN